MECPAQPFDIKWVQWVGGWIDGWRGLLTPILERIYILQKKIS